MIVGGERIWDSTSPPPIIGNRRSRAGRGMKSTGGLLSAAAGWIDGFREWIVVWVMEWKDGRLPAE